MFSQRKEQAMQDLDDQPATNVRISGVHHIAVSTRNIKEQIEFFTDVLGGELVGLFWMHDVPDGMHAFIRLNDCSLMSFVQLPAMNDIEPQIGVSYAANAGQPSAPGALQHVAFRVNSHDELLAMRDRIRSRGINVIGYLDHGMCQSIYFAGPEHLVLEVAVSETPMEASTWIDPEVVAKAGIDTTELERYTAPAIFSGEAGSIPQPPIDPQQPHLSYPAKAYAAMMAMSDDVVRERYSHPEPPVSPAAS